MFWFRVVPQPSASAAAALLSEVAAPEDAAARLQELRGEVTRLEQLPNFISELPLVHFVNGSQVCAPPGSRC